MDSTLSPNLLNAFLLVYFYCIENELNSTKNELLQIKFQSEEANTDEHLKRYFQAYLTQNNTIKNTQLKKLCIKIDEKIHEIDIEQLLNYRIVNVFLPEELTDNQKKNIRTSKKSVYTNPDLYLAISDGETLFYESVELKSTKDNNRLAFH